jgi:hypothetical protein
MVTIDFTAVLGEPNVSYEARHVLLARQHLVVHQMPE